MNGAGALAIAGSRAGTRLRRMAFAGGMRAGSSWQMVARVRWRCFREAGIVAVDWVREGAYAIRK